MILANFKELDENGNIIKEGFNQSSTISLEFINDKKSKKNYWAVSQKTLSN